MRMNPIQKANDAIREAIEWAKEQHESADLAGTAWWEETTMVVTRCPICRGDHVNVGHVWQYTCLGCGYTSKAGEFLFEEEVPPRKAPYDQIVEILKHYIEEVETLRNHVCEWDENDYCIICGADGRA